SDGDCGLRIADCRFMSLFNRGSKSRSKVLSIHNLNPQSAVRNPQSMLFRLTEVTKAYGAQEVLRGVTFQINPGEHVGLVGHNGAGKTTLLRLIMGAETPDDGEIERLRGFRYGALAQHVDFSGEMTVMDVALDVFEKLRALEAKMRDLEHAMT